MKGLINLDYDKTYTKKNKEEPRGLINLDLVIKKTNKAIKWLHKRHKKKQKKQHNIKQRNMLIE
jgi:hypothetical protein